MNSNAMHGTMGMFAALLVAASGMATAQTPRGGGTALQVGLHAEGVLAAPTANFITFPGVQNCMSATGTAGFEGGTGGGFSVFGLLALRPTPGAGFASHLGGAVRVGFSSSSTRFTADEPIGSASDAFGNVVPVVDRYNITVKTGELRVEPSGNYRLSAEVPLFVSLGARLSYLAGGTYEQYESIASPAGATFGDGSSERNRTAGDLTEVRALQVGMTFGIGYEIPLGPTFSLRPELSGLLALTSPVPGVDWSPHEVRFGLGVLYTLPRESSSPLQEE